MSYTSADWNIITSQSSVGLTSILKVLRSIPSFALDAGIDVSYRGGPIQIPKCLQFHSFEYFRGKGRN